MGRISKAPVELSAGDYADLCSSWHAKQNGLTWDLCLGPLVTSFRAVTRDALMRALPLLMLLLTNGSGAVMNNYRLQSGLETLFASKPGSVGCHLGQFPGNAVCTHISICMSMLRALKREDANAGKHMSYSQAYKKSGALRKQILAGDWVVLAQAFERLPSTEADDMQKDDTISLGPRKSLTPEKAWVATQVALGASEITAASFIPEKAGTASHGSVALVSSDSLRKEKDGAALHGAISLSCKPLVAIKEYWKTTNSVNKFWQHRLSMH